MCLCSFQCWFRWRRDEHSRTPDYLSQSWSSTSYGSYSKHRNTKKWIANHSFNARFSHNIFHNDMQRCFLHSSTIYLNPFLVHRRKWADKPSSPNNSKTCNAMDRQTSDKCSSSSQQILKSDHKFHSKISYDLTLTYVADWFGIALLTQDLKSFKKF